MPIIISIVVGMAAGCIPIAGYNMGVGLKQRVRSLFSWLPMPVSDILTFVISAVLVGRTYGELGESGRIYRKRMV